MQVQPLVTLKIYHQLLFMQGVGVVLKFKYRLTKVVQVTLLVLNYLVFKSVMMMNHLVVNQHLKALHKHSQVWVLLILIWLPDKIK